MSSNVIELFGKITRGIQYKPLLCSELPEYDLNNLDFVLNHVSSGAFLLKIDDNNKLAVSKWVSPKRTRSYPYARVYDTLKYTGKRVTIIPIFKDEGADGDRDFIQWDTIALMSLLGVYTIIAFYSSAERGEGKNKIKNQKFDYEYIRANINKLVSFQSDALHWNLEQIKQIENVADKALSAYDKIAKTLNVSLHSREHVKERISKIYKSMDTFMAMSRKYAKMAQNREAATVQPKEYLQGAKAKITIENFLGGCYFFTCDEVIVKDEQIYLIECKHGKKCFPTKDDVKDGLLKLALYTNLSEITFEGKKYVPKAVLKLTTFGNERFCLPEYSENLMKEALENGFEVMFINI